MRRNFKQALLHSIWGFAGAFFVWNSSSVLAQNYDAILENKKMIEQLKVRKRLSRMHWCRGCGLANGRGSILLMSIVNSFQKPGKPRAGGT